jgi:tRNA dimethylallyltransferase
MKPKIIVIVGPTAVGKTALSIEIAKKFNGEVISGDSMQVYKKLDIGTAKVTKEEMNGITHHMIDILEPYESFSVADFQSRVRKCIEDIHSRGKNVIIAGGTGLYIQSVLYNYQFSNEARDNQYEQKIIDDINTHGIDYVYGRLQQIDPEQAKKIHPNNERRVIRALEVYDRTGVTMTEQSIQSTNSIYDSKIIGLDMERSVLYYRINKRVDEMIAKGLLNEVQYMVEKDYLDCQSMKGIGYKELIPYVQGEEKLETSIELLKRNSRRFAKRQYTWFRNKMNVEWYAITLETKDKVFQNILLDLEGFLRKK